MDPAANSNLAVKNVNKVGTSIAVRREEHADEMAEQNHVAPGGTLACDEAKPESSELPCDNRLQITPTSEGNIPALRTPEDRIQEMAKFILTGAERQEGVPSMGEPHLMHVIAEWPQSNTDFEMLTKMDDELSTRETLFVPAVEILDPDDWFVRPDLSDEDIPPGQRLRMNPGQLHLTPIESWTSIRGRLAVEHSGGKN